MPPVLLGVALLPLLAGCEKRTPGEALYRKHCAHCHGVDGAGNTPAYMGNQWANLLDDAWQSSSGDEYSIATVVREGIFAKMPANSKLSDDEIRLIVDWLYQLRAESQ